MKIFASEPLAVSHQASGRWQFRPEFSLLGDAYIPEGRSTPHGVCKSGQSCFPSSWIQHVQGLSDKHSVDAALALGGLQGA